MNYLNLLGVNLFLYIYIVFNSHISLSIYINGILYHSLGYKILYYNDLLFNIYYIIYGLIYSKYDKKYSITLFSIFIYMIKKYGFKIKKNSKYDQIIHVSCIQIPFFITLYYMQKLKY